VKNSLVALAVLACVRTAGAAILCPTTVQPGDQFAAEVTLDTGFSALGAYSVMLNYDPSAVTVVTVDGGSAPEFTVPPVVNTFAPGSLVISDFQAHSLTSPSGTVSVARVNLTAADRRSVGLRHRRCGHTRCGRRKLHDHPAASPSPVTSPNTRGDYQEALKPDSGACFSNLVRIARCAPNPHGQANFWMR